MENNPHTFMIMLNLKKYIFFLEKVQNSYILYISFSTRETLQVDRLLIIHEIYETI